MPAEINYKNKYLELRSKYMNDMDMSFRLGFEQGQQQSQVDQAAQQQAQEDQMAQAAAGGAQPGQPGAEGMDDSSGMPGEEQPESAHPGGSELDQHIAKLESLIGGSDSAKSPEIQKSLEALISLRKKELQTIEMKKSDNAIKGIVKALHKPKFKLSVQASHNLNDSAKKAITMQQKIVDDVMKKMEEEEKKASSSVKDILNVEGLTDKV